MPAGLAAPRYGAATEAARELRSEGLWLWDRLVAVETRPLTLFLRWTLVGRVSFLGFLGNSSRPPEMALT
jgi:hypothetical protein